MMNIVQQRDLGRQIMSVSEKISNDQGVTPDFREQMLLHNHLDGILPFEVMMEDDEKRYDFNIGDKYTLEEYFGMNDASREKMIFVLRQILETIYRGREYMLEENDYIIGADTVFIDEDMKIFLAYYPGYAQDLKSQLRELAKYFMEKVDYTDESVVMLIYGFYMRTKESGCTFEELLKSLKSVSSEQDKNVNSAGWNNILFDKDRSNNIEIQSDGYQSRQIPEKIISVNERRSFNERSSENERSSVNEKSSANERGFTNESSFVNERPENIDSVSKNDNNTRYYNSRNCGSRFDSGQEEKRRAETLRPGLAKLPGEDRRRKSEVTKNKAEEYTTLNNNGDMTEIQRSGETDHKKPDPNKVFAESPMKLKIIGFLLPPAAVLILFILFRSGLLYNGNTGRNDVIKTGLALILVAGGCFEAEKYMWMTFAKKLGKSLASAEKESGEATVFLYGNDTAGYPFSLVSDDQPAINVTHFPFFVGKDAQHCDYVMTTQVGISRYHMKIDREGDDFTISDLNSTNGTFINGERLAPHLPHRIRRGDELRIGKCIYYCN